MSEKDQGSHRFVVAAAFSVAVAMIAQQLAGKAIRDAYFLSVYDAEFLPRVMTVASILSVVAVFGVTRLYAKFAPARLVPGFFAASGALFAAEWALSATLPTIAAISVYLHTTSFGAVAISGFWSVMNERFDPYTAKKVIGRIAGGATLGGVLGGLAAWQGASRVSLPTMLLALCAVNVFCAVMLLGVGGPKEAKAEKAAAKPAEKAERFWTVFEETPYLTNVAWLVGLTALGTAGFDYVFKATAAASIGDKSQLVSFFALFYLVVGVLTFLLQNAAAQRVLSALGLSTAIATLPGTILAFGLLALLFPGLAMVVALRGGAATVESSFYRSGYELLYTPLSPGKKRPTKTLIDVGGDKLGAAIGGAIAVFLVGLVPGAATQILIVLSIACAAVGVWLSRRLAAGYVNALEERLASGEVAVQDVPLQDAATRMAVQRTMAAMSRHDLLASLDDRRLSVPVRSLRPVPAAPALPTEDNSGQIRALAAFEAADPAGTEWALRRTNPIPVAWVPLLVPLLADERCAPLVEPELEKVAPAAIGTLTDALLSRRTPLEARRKLTSILGSVCTDRSARALVSAIDAEPFEIRFRAAAALSGIKRRNPNVYVSPETVYRAALRAIAHAKIEFYGTGLDDAGQLSAAGTEAGRVVAYCVRLFSAVLPPRPLALALEALASDEKARRGTGLEYLENVLPSDLQTALLPFFENVEIARYASRDSALILEEIARDESERVRSLENLESRVRRIYGLS